MYRGCAVDSEMPTKRGFISSHPLRSIQSIAPLDNVCGLPVPSSRGNTIHTRTHTHSYSFGGRDKTINMMSGFCCTVAATGSLRARGLARYGYSGRSSSRANVIKCGVFIVLLWSGSATSGRTENERATTFNRVSSSEPGRGRSVVPYVV